MNKLAIYILLVLIYLGLSKNPSPKDGSARFLANKHLLANLYPESPISIVLTHYSQAGVFIKTYYHRYRIIHGFKVPQTITFRVSYDFYQDNLDNLGMSLFRREETTQKESLVTLPPGSLYIGDLAYGNWSLEDSGQKIWHFHRAYKHFPRMFKWLSLKPSEIFYQEIQLHLEQQKPFYGPNNEFGTRGSLTKKAYPLFFQREDTVEIDLKALLRHYLKTTSLWTSQS